MSQLFALVWLKWTLVRNSLRSRRAVAGRVAAALGVLAGLGLSLAMAAGVGAGAYFLSAHALERGGLGRARVERGLRRAALRLHGHVS